jgi:hypothetical protein
MSRSISKADALISQHGAADLRSERQRPAERRAALRRPRRRNADGNTRLTGISASFVLALMLLEVVTVALGVKSITTLHVAAGLVLIGPMVVKLGSVTYRMASYYRRVSKYPRARQAFCRACGFSVERSQCWCSCCLDAAWS